MGYIYTAAAGTRRGAGRVNIIASLAAAGAIGLAAGVLGAMSINVAIAAAGASVNDKPAAQFISSGSFSGGTVTEGMVLSGIRFGKHRGFTRMVLDLEPIAAGQGERSPASAHPVYSVRYEPYPYRLSIHLEGVRFEAEGSVQSKPALPFSIVTSADRTIKELQVYLGGPVEFKLIEIDDPAKLSIDVRPHGGIAIPNIFAVQLMQPLSAAEAFALVERGSFPDGYSPSALVLGEVVVVEQAFTDPGLAASMDADLRAMGYASIINERRGDELPQR